MTPRKTVNCKVAAVEILVICNLQTAPAVSVVAGIVGWLTVCQYYVVSVVLFMIIVDCVQLVLSWANVSTYSRCPYTLQLRSTPSVAMMSRTSWPRIGFCHDNPEFPVSQLLTPVVGSFWNVPVLQTTFGVVQWRFTGFCVYFMTYFYAPISTIVSGVL